MNFNIHGLLKFKIESEDEKSLNHFAEDYFYFKTDEEIESDFDIIISDFKPSNDNCYVINNKYYIKENYLFCEDRLLTVKRSLCIKDIENKPTVYFKERIFSVFGSTFLRDCIIEPLIGFKLAQKGYFLLHAAGVAVNNKGFIFPACQGVGKTSTILNLGKSDGVFLGNDAVILSSDGMVYSFPSFIHIFGYNLENCPDVYERFKVRDKLQAKMKHLVYKSKYISPSLDVNPMKLFASIGGKYPLQSAILLNKINRNELNVMENIDKEKLIRRLLLITQHETQYLNNCLAAYLYVFPDSEIKNRWQTLENNLRNALTKVSCYEVEIPSEYNSKVYEEINKILKRDSA
jgi:hypothetical protein